MNMSSGFGRKLVRKILQWQHLGLVLILIVTLALHFVIILLPAEPMFDEQFYVPDARRIIAGQGSERGEHPPLGKLFVVAGIRIFGDNQFGWRLPSVICGTVGIILFYLICRKLGIGQKATLLATFLFSFENLTFTQAAITMLDVYSFVLMLAALLVYLKRWYLIAGALIGFAALAKLSGALVVPVIVLHWVLARRDKPRWFIASILVAAATFVAFLPVFNYLVAGMWRNPFDLIKDMWAGTSSLTFDWVVHEAASRPWEWMVWPAKMAYWYTPNYSGQLSYTIWALIIPTYIYLLYRASRRSDAALFSLSWFVGTYIIWFPVVLIFNRVTYPYYIYPAVGALCIGIGMGLSHALEYAVSRGEKIFRVVAGAVAFYCLGHIAVFLLMTAVVHRM